MHGHRSNLHLLHGSGSQWLFAIDALESAKAALEDAARELRANL